MIYVCILYIHAFIYTYIYIYNTWTPKPLCQHLSQISCSVSLFVISTVCRIPMMFFGSPLSCLDFGTQSELIQGKICWTPPYLNIYVNLGSKFMVSSNISLESIYCHTSPHSVSISICIACWVALPSKNGTQGQDGWRWLLFHQHLCMAWSSILTHVASWQLNGLGITDFGWCWPLFCTLQQLGRAILTACHRVDRAQRRSIPQQVGILPKSVGQKPKMNQESLENHTWFRRCSLFFNVFQGFFMLCVCRSID